MSRAESPKNESMVSYVFYPQSQIPASDQRRNLSINNLIGYVAQTSGEDIINPPIPNNYEFALGIADHHEDLMIVHYGTTDSIAPSSYRISGWCTDVGFRTCAITSVDKDTNKLDLTAHKNSLAAGSIALILSMITAYDRSTSHLEPASGSFTMRTGSNLDTTVKDLASHVHDEAMRARSPLNLALELEMTFENSRAALARLKV